MNQYVAVITSRSETTDDGAKFAMASNRPEIGSLGYSVSQETLDLAHSLRFDLPGLDWEVEVNVLGVHRIVVHFKGASIDIDPVG